MHAAASFPNTGASAVAQGEEHTNKLKQCVSAMTWCEVDATAFLLVTAGWFDFISSPVVCDVMASSLGSKLHAMQVNGCASWRAVQADCPGS